VTASWLVWDSRALWLLWLISMLSLALGLAVTSWAYRPLTTLAERARELAGISTGGQGLAGLLWTDDPDDEAIASALGCIAANLQEIRSLNRIGQLVASEDDLQVILRTIAEEAVALLHADAALIGTWNEEQQVFRDVAACNLPVMFPGREFGARESLSSQVAKTGQVHFVDDYACYPYRIPELDHLGLCAALGVPLMAGSMCKGALVVHSLDRTRHFTPREGELLATFATQAGAAFEKARLYQLALDQLAKLEIARQELEMTLAHMVRIQEEERSRIAADAHDGVVQMMTGALCELQAAIAYFPDDLEQLGAKQERARDLVRESIHELRRVIYDLRPIALDTAGLVPAVESLIEDLGHGYAKLSPDLRLELSVVGKPGRFSPEVEIGAYRIIQEALNNAIKHSAASVAKVGIEVRDGVLQCSVRDDGVGFSVEKATSNCSRKTGLMGMRERARGMGGKLSISSGAGRGTMVVVEIPCRPGACRDQSDALRPFSTSRSPNSQGTGLQLEEMAGKAASSL
jgi:signal transduction histidine kinase